MGLRTRTPGGICAVSTLETIYNKYGFHVLDRALRLAVGTWEGEQDSLTANMLKGITHLIVAFGDDLRDDLFKDKLSRLTPREISRTAKERRAGSLGYAETLIIEYNKKMRYPLQWAKLYARKSYQLDNLDLDEAYGQEQFYAEGLLDISYDLEDIP